MAVVDIMTDIGDAFADILAMPGDLAAYVRGAAAEAKQDVVETIRRFEDLESRYGGGSKDPNRNAGPGGSGGSSDPVFSSSRAEDLKAKRAFRRAGHALKDIRIELDILDRTLARVEQGADMNVPAHVVADGETLHAVSVRYYGTADYWSAIARRNKLTSFDLAAGQQLIIPKVEAEIETAFGPVSFDNFWDWFLERRRKWWKQVRRRHTQKPVGGYYQFGPDVASLVNLGFGTKGEFSERPPWMQEYTPGTQMEGGPGGSLEGGYGKY
jgi:LysM repeat protein